MMGKGDGSDPKAGFHGEDGSEFGKSRYVPGKGKTIEKRRWRRIPVSLPVRMRTKAGEKLYEGKSITHGSMLIRMDNPPALWERVYLSFWLPGMPKGQELKLIGFVSRILKQNNRYYPGIAVEFSAVPPESAGIISEFIERSLSEENREIVIQWQD
jgi:hypothetical protein